MESDEFINMVNDGKTLINRNINGIIENGHLTIHREITSSFTDIEDSCCRGIVSLRYQDNHILTLSTLNWEVKE